MSRKSNTSIPTLNIDTGPIFNKTETADAIADNFETIHKLTNNSSDQETINEVNIKYLDLITDNIDRNSVPIVTPSEVMKALRQQNQEKPLVTTKYKI